MAESSSVWSLVVELLQRDPEATDPASYEDFSYCVQQALDIIEAAGHDVSSGFIPSALRDSLLGLAKQSPGDPLSEHQAAVAVATALDEMLHLSFSGFWLGERDPVFELTVGDWYPIPRQRPLGKLKATSRPENLAIRPGEIAHARRFDGCVRVTIDSRFADQVDELCGSLERVGILWPWPGASRREVPLVDLARAAFADGATVVIAPELASEGVDLADLWSSVPAGAVLVPGSRRVDTGEGEVNRVTLAFGSDIQAQLQHQAIAFHDKFSPFVADGKPESITPRHPHLTVFAGHRYRLTSLVCKDLLSPDVTVALARLGISLLVVPAWSAKVDGFIAAAEFLASHAQTVTVCANGDPGGDRIGGIVGRPVRRQTVATHGTLDGPGYALYALDQDWSYSEPPLNPRVKQM